MHTKKYFAFFALFFLSLASLRTDIISLQKTRSEIIHNLDTLFDLQNYYDHEAARQETLVGRYKHKLDSYFFKKSFSLETTTQHQSYINQEIDRISTQLARIDRALNNNPAHEVSHDDNEIYDETYDVTHPTFLEKNSAKLYTFAAFALVAGAYTIYKPQTISNVKTASSSLAEIWEKGIDSLQILLGLKKNPVHDSLQLLAKSKEDMLSVASDFTSHIESLETKEKIHAAITSNPEEAKEVIKSLRQQLMRKHGFADDLELSKHLTEELKKNSKELAIALEQKDGIDVLAILATQLHLQEFGDSIRNNVESPERWGQLLGRSVTGPAAKAINDYLHSIPSESIERSKKILNDILNAGIKRTTNLSETAAVYQRIAQHLLPIIDLMFAGIAIDIAILLDASTPLIEKGDFSLNLVYALIPISCSILGMLGLRKVWRTIRNNKFTTVQDHLMELLIITPDDSAMSESHYGQLVYWTDKLETFKKSWLLSIKQRVQLTTLLSQLRNSTLPPQQKTAVLSHYALV